jgi:hypothetical protein
MATMEKELLKLIKEQTSTMAAMQQGMLVLKDQLTAMYGVHQFFIELIMDADPNLKAKFHHAISQVLDQPERAQNNQHFLEALKALEECARLPSRTTPEGRRGWIRSVPSPKGGGPENEDS